MNGLWQEGKNYSGFNNHLNYVKPEEVPHYLNNNL